MTVNAPSHDQTARMADDITQLTRPITVPVPQRTRRTRWVAVTHPPLLDQLRAATQPGHPAHGPERHQIPQSRPPVNLDAITALTDLYVALSGWHTRLNLPSPPPGADWQKTALRQLIGAMATLAPSIADQLAADVHHWWRLAATHSGWSQEELRQLQRQT